MSFYGNIINYLNIKKIKVPGKEYNAEESGNTLDLTEDLTLSIEEYSEQDGYLNYGIKLGKQDPVKLKIPLDLILSEAKVEVKEQENKESWGDPGTYIHLIFKTEESTKQDVYIPIADWYISDTADTSTINLTIQNNKITAEIINESIDTNKLADGAVTEDKLADGAVTKNKLDTNLLDKISKSVQFSYDEKNKRLKISYSKEENDNGTTV